MTTRLSRSSRVSLVSLLALASLAAGCGLLKKKGDDADASVEAGATTAAAGDAAPAPTTGPVAANVADVARFPDEKPIENVAGAIQRPANVREIPSVGKIVAVLNKGNAVTQIAQRGAFFLVVFDNPTDAKRLMGWVPQESFTAAPAVDAGIKALACTAPEISLVGDGPFCGRVCASDADCATAAGTPSQACKGAANRFANGKLGDAVTVCTVFTPPVAANGAKPVLGVTPITRPLGGGGLTPLTGLASANADVSDPLGGKCPQMFALVAKDGKCHKTCPVGQCRKPNVCVHCAEGRVCSASASLCN